MFIWSMETFQFQPGASPLLVLCMIQAWNVYCDFSSFDNSDWELPVSSEIATLRDLSFRSRPDKTGPLYGRYHQSPGHVNQVTSFRLSLFLSWYLQSRYACTKIYIKRCRTIKRSASNLLFARPCVDIATRESESLTFCTMVVSLLCLTSCVHEKYRTLLLLYLFIIGTVHLVCCSCFYFYLDCIYLDLASNILVLCTTEVKILTCW